MKKLNDIVSFLDDYLEIEDIKDNSWNGLQIEGNSEVKKIAYAVSAGSEVFQKSADEKADMIIVHHGQFWKGGDPRIIGWNKQRLDILMDNGISLYASHLPLDRHKEVGNNAQLLKLLGARIKESFSLHEGKNVGWIGELASPKSIKEIEKMLNSSLNTKSIVLPFGKEKIKRIAICSGGGDYADFVEAIEKKVDLYITGDTSEIYNMAKDAKINVIFGGHYATEILGVKYLAEVIEKKFKLETVFIDIPSGL